MTVNGYRIIRWKDGRSWALYDPKLQLVCLCVYKRGALEVVRRLTEGK